MSGSLSDDVTRLAWEAIAQVLTAHVTMLRDVAMLDDAVHESLVGAIDSIRESTPAARSIAPMLREFEQRIDTITPPEVRGAHLVGRGSADTLAAATRLVMRAHLIKLSSSANALRGTLIDVAEAHAVTLVAAHIDGKPAQPTTIAHILGGVIGPLERASSHLKAAFDAVNQSPMGAASLASTGFEIDPGRTASLLGFENVIENSFDAVSAIDHVVEALYAARALGAPVSRLVEELMQWIRSQPDAVQLGEDRQTSDPALPQLESPIGLVALGKDSFEVERMAANSWEAIATMAFGPVLGPDADTLNAASEVIACASNVLDRATDLFANGLQFNRAALANRAGKGMITSSDLADFLMIEEQLPPAVAQAIASRVIASAREQGKEASGITQELIDSAALLIIGRELRVEFETISRYLAPRRFVERRALPMGPAPSSVRAYLVEARRRLDEDKRWMEEVERGCDLGFAAHPRVP